MPGATVPETVSSNKPPVCRPPFPARDRQTQPCPAQTYQKPRLHKGASRGWESDRQALLPVPSQRTKKPRLPEPYSRGLCPCTNFETVTCDNGKEFASHEKISSELRADWYFARPYHSWERGLSENTNGHASTSPREWTSRADAGRCEQTWTNLTTDRGSVLDSRRPIRCSSVPEGIPMPC